MIQRTSEGLWFPVSRHTINSSSVSVLQLIREWQYSPVIIAHIHASSQQVSVFIASSRQTTYATLCTVSTTKRKLTINLTPVSHRASSSISCCASLDRPWVVKLYSLVSDKHKAKPATTHSSGNTPGIERRPARIGTC